VAKLISEVADALDYAHGRGVIHRDIKPANLMLSGDGKLCITDFGLARVAQEPGMTVSGSLMGTPAYMSPEQITAGRVKLDHRTDVYSLGAVLYELLSHRRPFPGESREEILGGILTKDPRPPRRFNPRIPLDLETICQKAMEKDQDRRYQKAGEFANDLRQYLQGGLITARRAGLPRRTWKSIRRHPVTATVIVGVIVIALLGTFAQRLWIGRSEEAAQRLVADAEVDLRKGTYRQGLEKIDRALEIDPDLAGAKRIRGRLLFEAWWDPRALAQAARELLELDPEDWEAHGWLAFAAFHLGDIDAEAHRAAVEHYAPDTADAWYIRAVVSRSQTEAVRYLDRVLEIDPGHVWARLFRSEAKRRLHDTEGGIADARTAIAARPRASRGYRYLGNVYLFALRDFDQALDQYAKAVAVAPDDPLAYSSRSWVYRPGYRDEVELGLKDVNRALEIAPAAWYFLDDRAYLLARMSRYDEALDDARRAIELEPHYFEGWRQALWALWRLQRLDELRQAMGELRDLAVNWPNRHLAAVAYQSLSYYHRVLDEDDEAMAAARKAVELDPMEVDGYTQLVYAKQAQAGAGAIGEACDELQALELSEPEPLKKRAVFLRDGCRRPEAALADLASAIEFAPQWADLYYERGQLHSSRAEYAAAIADYDLAIERAPLWPDPHCLRGNSLTQLKRYEEALASITRALELAPRHANALFNRANLYMNLERFEEALADLDRCIELAGGPRVTAGNVRVTQAMALAKLGREEEALEAADLLVANNPSLDGAIRFRAQFSMLLGRSDEALEYAERAVEHSPKNAMNYAYRARAILNGDDDCDHVLADLATAHELAPDNPAVANEIAWCQATMVCRQCPDGYDGRLALDLARMAVEDKPEGDYTQIVHGMALYRHGRLLEAREALLRAAELRVPKPEPWELFALAMTEWKLGNRADARSHYNRGVARMDETYPRFPEFILFRDEAAEVLGIEE